jgi:hypothetical protein
MNELLLHHLSLIVVCLTCLHVYSFSDAMTVTFLGLSNINTFLGKPTSSLHTGIQIGHLHKKRLKMLRYYMFHLQRIQRNFHPDVATMNILPEIYLLKEVYNEDLKPTLPEKLTKTDKVREVIENI